MVKRQTSSPVLKWAAWLHPSSRSDYYPEGPLSGEPAQSKLNHLYAKAAKASPTPIQIAPSSQPVDHRSAQAQTQRRRQAIGSFTHKVTLEQEKVLSYLQAGRYHIYHITLPCLRCMCYTHEIHTRHTQALFDRLMSF